MRPKDDAWIDELKALAITLFAMESDVKAIKTPGNGGVDPWC